MIFYFSLYFSKLTNILIRFLKKGAGHTLPGHVFLKFNPEFLSSKRVHFSKGIILISGTNGKTTTSKIVTHLLKSQGLRVLNNETGANLVNGITSSILLNMNWRGKLQANVAVLEVDEFAVPLFLNKITPDVVLLLNLSRDQLDRFGETDIILDKWIKALSNLNISTKLILDSTEESFKKLEDAFQGTTFYFNDDVENLNHTSLKGMFNAKNVNASLQVCEVLGYKKDDLLSDLGNFESAYGRGEVVTYKGKEFHIFLAKNPASFNHNIDLLSSFDPNNTALLFVLNDNIPDGRDVSWIYDIDTASLSHFVPDYSHIYISGTRYLDMAIRLRYANVPINESRCAKEIEKILKQVVENKKIKHVLLFPNYSAMLESRKILTGKAIL